jgi:nucleoside-diphosphate-sugar epimerase
VTTLEGAHVLITGGAGFIGSHLVERLAGRPGNRIRVLDTFRRDALRPAGLDKLPNVEVMEGDVMDPASVARALDGVDHVVHLASIAGVDTVMKQPVATMRISLLGTANVLEAAYASGRCGRFIDFSTSEVFGRFAYHVTEWDVSSIGAVGEARWTYAVAKLATEHLCMTYHRQFGFPAVAVRPFNVYGPRQVGEGAIHHFIVRALKGEPLQVHNDGSQIRAWTYVDDVIDAVERMLVDPRAVGHSFNVGNPRSTVTIYNLARDVVRLSSSGSRIEQVKWDHPDVELRVPSVKKAVELLDWSAKVDLEEGLLRTIYWYRARR